MAKVYYYSWNRETNSVDTPYPTKVPKDAWIFDNSHKRFYYRTGVNVKTKMTEEHKQEYWLFKTHLLLMSVTLRK